jgi:hypothetical protein
VSCSLLGLFTCVVGMIAWDGSFAFTWPLIELCWIADIIFNGFIFYMLSRTRYKKVEVSITPKTSTSTTKTETSKEETIVVS